MQKLILLSIVSSAFVWGEKICEDGEKIWMKGDKYKILMKCQNGQWKGIVKEKRGAPGGPPCTDSPAMNNTCLAERGHCLQFTQKGAKMDGDCPGTCDSCDGCRCQDNHQWHTYCPYWRQYCDSAGVIGNWMTTNCRKTCGKCKCKCCSYNGKQHGVGASIPLPEKCGELVCEEGLIASFSPLLSGAAEHAVTHPEELTLNFRKLHPGSDCCMLPGNARASNGSLMPNITMAKEGWKGIINTVPTTCCHGILCTPFDRDRTTTRTHRTTTKPPTTTTTATPTIFNATCDNIMILYVDGIQVVNENDNNWSKTSSILLPAGTRSVALSCQDVGVEEGFIASTGDGVITDSSWKCSSNIPPSGWELPDYDDTTWTDADVLGLNGMSPWGMRPGISEQAKWIWAPGLPRGDATVYCRKMFT